jgi:hypothetical protein
MMKPVFVNRALDNLKTKLCLMTDAALSRHLGISRQMLSQVRNGDVGVPASLLAKVLEKLDSPLSNDDVLSLLPSRVLVVLNQHKHRFDGLV